ncbi:MAG: flagellar hook-basal body complex protein [Tistlia sp.]
MENPSYITLSRQTVLRRQMDVLANNLANMSTPAFKAEALMVIEHESPISTQGPRGMRNVSFVKDLATVRDLSEGALVHTDNPLDVAISGDGYFAIETDDGERYTRKGSFMLDGEGRLVTTAGQPVLDDRSRPIVVPPGSGEIEIAQDGTIPARDPLLPGQNVVLGRFKVVAFENEYTLKREANGLNRPGAGADPEPVAAPTVFQGMIEKSNVNGIVEMTRLIETVRNFQSASKVVDDEHERQRKAIETLTRSSLSA